MDVDRVLPSSTDREHDDTSDDDDDDDCDSVTNNRDDIVSFTEEELRRVQRATDAKFQVNP